VTRSGRKLIFAKTSSMHSAIVVINMPEKHESKELHPKWFAFLADTCRAFEPMMNSLEDEASVVRLSENVWQLNFRDNPGTFTRLISCAMHHQLTYGLLQLNEAPVWHPVSFHPTPR
jgi:hypothetical protein